jgi:tetratricopeptide (TPR) repeat protein
MPEYLASVRRDDGRKVTVNVDAGSADEAMRLLRERGYEDVVLHSDDLTALYVRQREKAEHLSPRDYLVIRNFPRGVGVFVVMILNGYRKLWAVFAIAGVAFVSHRYVGGRWDFWDWLCVALLLFPLAFAIAVAFRPGRKSARYRQMMDALYCGRWEEALRRADRVGPMSQAHEIPFRKAQALAGMDRLDEALTLVDRFGDGKAMPSWLYRSMLGQVYEFARRRDDAFAQLERSVELAPDNATVLLGLGRSVIWRKRDARRAREILDKARAHALSDMTAPFADMLEGLILLEEGRPRDAWLVLEAVYKVFHSRRHMTLGYLPVEQATLGRALAHAALGESDEALKLYSKVRPRLVALRNEVHDRCDRTIGVPQDG